MRNRRDFVKTVAGAAAGSLVVGSGLARAGLLQTPPGTRRQVSINGKRIKVIDVHGHCAVPMPDVLKGTSLEKSGPAATGPLIIGPERIKTLDEQGIDTQVLTQQGAWWYAATDRSLADQIVKKQNEQTAAWCKANPDRFVALAQSMQDTDAIVHVIIFSPTNTGNGQSVLIGRALSQATAGSFDAISTLNALPQKLATLAETISVQYTQTAGQYVLEYASDSTNPKSELKLSITRPDVHVTMSRQVRIR